MTQQLGMWHRGFESKHLIQIQSTSDFTQLSWMQSPIHEGGERNWALFQHHELGWRPGVKPVKAVSHLFPVKLQNLSKLIQVRSITAFSGTKDSGTPSAFLCCLSLISLYYQFLIGCPSSYVSKFVLSPTILFRFSCYLYWTGCFSRKAGQTVLAVKMASHTPMESYELFFRWKPQGPHSAW
jgi:hypothetical protein